MNLVSALESIENTFECVQGEYWPWADRNREKPYVTLEWVRYLTGEVVEESHSANHEQILANHVISTFDWLRGTQSHLGLRKPKLYWRMQERVDFEPVTSRLDIAAGVMRTRIYIDGCQDYGMRRVKDKPTHLKLVWERDKQLALPAPENV